MRLPNRYGTVSKLAGHRRKPWIIREGLSGNQRPIGYAATRAEALEMLAAFNHRPWDVDANKITLGELLDLWIRNKAWRLGASNRKGLLAGSKYMGQLRDMAYCAIKTQQMQYVIDNAQCSNNMRVLIKRMFAKLDAYAMELEIITRCHSAQLDTIEAQIGVRRAIPDDEVDKLWEHQDEPFVDVALILIYSGWRANELLALTRDNIDLDNHTMLGGIKTRAGKGRIVPIHHRIYPLVVARLEKSVSGYLIELNGRRMSYDAMRRHWGNMMANMGMDYLAHECRHTLRTRLDRTSANRVCIDRIMGHQSSNTGEQTYTHKTIDELVATIELVTN